MNTYRENYSSSSWSLDLFLLLKTERKRWTWVTSDKKRHTPRLCGMWCGKDVVSLAIKSLWSPSYRGWVVQQSPRTIAQGVPADRASPRVTDPSFSFLPFPEFLVVRLLKRNYHICHHPEWIIWGRISCQSSSEKYWLLRIQLICSLAGASDLTWATMARAVRLLPFKPQGTSHSDLSRNGLAWATFLTILLWAWQTPWAP